VRLTRGPGDERDLAAKAAAEGIETIVALGGDGTWGNVARGILESGRDARLVPVAAGTGNDFPHALNLPAHDPVAMARIAAFGNSVRADVGWANDVAFLNVAGFGLETEVVRTVQDIPGLRGPLLYIAAALPVLRTYRGLRASIQIENGPLQPMQRWAALIVSNGPRFGGGFRVAPGATVTDGKVDLIAVRDAAPFRRLQLFVRARLGTHLAQPEVERSAVSNIMLRFDQPALVDADGELHEMPTEVRVRVQPGAIRVGTV
jgi:diacylglycerol kinase (ATP)